MRRSFFSILTACVVLLCISVNGFAQGKLTPWHPTGGPIGGQMKAICIDSSGNLWTTLEKDGVYMSSDKGQTWLNFNRGLAQIGFNAANEQSATASKNGYIYAITNDQHHIARLNTNVPQTDWTWDTLYADKYHRVYDFVITTYPENWLFTDADTYDHPGDSTGGGHSIKRSTDNGITWTNFTTPLVDSNVAMFTHGAQGTYAAITGGEGGVFDHTVWYSPDDGQTWENRSALPGATQFIDSSDAMQDFIITNNGNMLLSTDQKSKLIGSADKAPLRGGRIYLSEDTGKTWRVVYQSPRKPDLDLVTNADALLTGIDAMVIARNSGTIFAAPHTYKIYSQNNGKDWKYGDTTTARDEDDPEHMTCTPDGKSVYYVVEPFGFYASNDSAKSFTRESADFKGIFMWGMAINSQQTLGVVSEDNFYVSHDNGNTWSYPIYYGKSEPAVPGVVTTTNDDFFLNGSFGVWRSKDNGASLEQVLGILPDGSHDATVGYYTRVVETNGRIFTWLEEQNNTHPILYSDNSGDKWDTLTSIPFEVSDEVSCLGASGDSIIATGLSGQCYFSIERGDNFTETSDGQGATGTVVEQPTKIIFHHFDNSILAMVKGSTAGGSGNGNAGIWQSFNLGASWNQIFPPKGDQANTLFPHGFPTDYFALDDDDEGTIFVSSDSGLFRSDNKVQTWTNVGVGLNWGNYDSTKYIPCTEIVQNVKNRRYYASSRAQSVFESVPELNGVHETNVTASANSTIVAFPNPSVDITRITFTLPQSATTQVQICDVLGRQVGQVTAGMLQAGSNTVEYDASKLTPGNYMIVLRFGETTQVSWMTVAR